MSDVAQDPGDDGKLGDERDDAHLAPAAGADAGIGLVDSPDQVSPESVGAGRVPRDRVGFGVFPAQGGVRLGDPASASSGDRRVGAIVASEVVSRFRYVGDDAGEKLEGGELLLGPGVGICGIVGLGVGGSLQGVSDLIGLFVPGEPLQADRRAQEVPAERRAAPPLEPGAVLPVDADGVVNGRSRSGARIGGARCGRRR